MVHRRHWLATAALSMVATVVVASCAGGAGGTATGTPGGSANGSAAQKTGTFVLGIDGPLTGGGAAGGQQMKNGVQMALDAIGNKIGGFTIKTVLIDDKADPGVGAQAMENAITSQGVQAVIGSYNTAVTIAQMDVVVRHKIPYYFVGGSALTIDAKIQANQDLYSYIVGKAYPKSDDLNKAYGEALNYYYGKTPAQFPFGKTYATYAEDTDYGRTNVTAVKASLDAAGWQLKSSDYFAINLTNHVTILEKLKAAQVSFVYVLGTAIPALAGVINQARQVGLRAYMTGGGIQGAPNWYQLVGANSEGLIDNVQKFTTKGLKWAQDYEVKYGVPATTSGAGTYYDYGNFLIAAMQRSLDEYGDITSDTMYKVGVNEVKTGKLTSKDGVVFQQLAYSLDSWPAPIVGAEYYSVNLIQYHNGTTDNVIWPVATATSTLQPIP
jgi:branched-chain amino acid transport system substrate-binding protein